MAAGDRGGECSGEQEQSRRAGDAQDARAAFSSWVCKVVVDGLAQIEEV